MSLNNRNKGPQSKTELAAKNLRDREKHSNTYREMALKLFPWVCGRCAREFSGKGIRELTVHHKDHNHDNNPSDGSNWELLCIYCHDNEHSSLMDAEWLKKAEPVEERKFTETFKPFANLDKILKK